MEKIKGMSLTKIGYINRKIKIFDSRKFRTLIKNKEVLHCFTYFEEAIKYLVKADISR